MKYEMRCEVYGKGLKKWEGLVVGFLLLIGVSI